MMISTKGRYALRVMIDLAQQPQEDFISLKAIAERQQVSMKYLEVIVALLVKGGLLKSQRGKEGGYRLTRPAAEITVDHVMTLTEGSLAPVACVDCGAAPCARAEICLTRPMWQHLDRLIGQYLSGITIQDLLDGRLEG